MICFDCRLLAGEEKPSTDVVWSRATITTSISKVMGEVYFLIVGLDIIEILLLTQ